MCSVLIYGLDSQARSLAVQQDSSDLVRFFLGTLNLKQENKIYLLEYDEELSQINSLSFEHPVGEIWNIETSFSSGQYLSTCYSDGLMKYRRAARIWRANIPEKKLKDVDACEVGNLEALFDISPQEQSIKNLLWNPLGDTTFLSVGEKNVNMHDLTTLQSILTVEPSVSKEPLFSGRWSPHHFAIKLFGNGLTRTNFAKQKKYYNLHCLFELLESESVKDHVGVLTLLVTFSFIQALFAATQATSVLCWDSRSSSQVFCIADAHMQAVRTVDFNPNKPYSLATGGDDGCIKFWDTRSCNEPLKILEQHTHWVWSVRYNHFHDQLLLSSGSDSKVCLHNVTSLSSDLFSHVESSESGEDALQCTRKELFEDRIIKVYEDHEDSVYATEWSSADPWVFASLSFDGRFVVNHVPSEVKYKILL
ncbi:EARP-interacting protein homolog [Zophobas morio]